MSVAASHAVRVAPIVSIQYLRAVAAIAVVVFHQLQEVHPAFLYGRHGVDIFFVISGFIMVALSDHRMTTPRQFIIDRIVRIVPLYWIGTIAVALTAWLGINFYQATADAAHLAKSLLFIPAYNPFGELFPTLYLGWTLNYEMFFYALFALSLFLAPAARLALMAAIFVTLVLVGRLVEFDGAILKTLTDPILLNFLAGMALGKLFGATLRARPTRDVTVAAVGLVVGLAVLSLMFHPLVFATLATLVVAAGLFLERGGMVPSIRWLKALGDASFSIYLFQNFAFEAVNIVFNRLGLDQFSLSRRVTSILAAIALGYVIFRLVEGPVTGFVRRRVSRLGRTRVLSPAAGDAPSAS